MSNAVSINSDTDEGNWDGTVNYCPSDNSEFCWTDMESDDSDSDSVDELNGEDLYTSIDSELARELEDLAKETAYEILERKLQIRNGGSLTRNCAQVCTLGMHPEVFSAMQKKPAIRQLLMLY